VNRKWMAAVVLAGAFVVGGAKEPTREVLPKIRTTH